MTTVTKDMTLGQVLQSKPSSAQVFLKWGIHCSGCPVASMETVEQGATMHGINVDELIEDLNKAE